MASSRNEKRPRPEEDDARVDDSEDSDVANAQFFQYNNNSAYTSFQPIDVEARVGRVRREKRGSWYSMVRHLKAPKNGFGPVPLASWLVHAVLGVEHPDADAPSSDACALGVSQGVSQGAPWETAAPQGVLDLLRFVIQAEDPRLTGIVWLVMKRRAGSWNAASKLIHSNATFARLLFKTDLQLIRTIGFLALVSRRPRLLKAVLESYACHVHGDGALPGVGAKVGQNLTCIALAIADCVFAADRGRSYEESRKAFVERSEKATSSTDTAHCLAAWGESIKLIMSLCSTDMPAVVWTSVPDDEIKSSTVLNCAVNIAELHPDFLDSVLEARGWTARDLESAMRAAIAPKSGVRGPNFVTVLAKLYAALLHEWKTNPTTNERWSVCDNDELAMVWRNLIVTTSGYDSVETGRGGNAPVPMSPFLAKLQSSNIRVSTKPDSAYMRHPEEWKSVFDAMIECHEPSSDLAKKWRCDPCEPLVWTTSSSLFDSIMRQVIRMLMDEPHKTKLLVHFINVLDKARGEGWPPPSWLSINSIFNKIAIHHPLALGLVIECASMHPKTGEKQIRVDDDGVKHFVPREEHREALKSALLLCVTKKRRPSARMLIEALSGHLDITIEYIEDEQDVRVGFLPYYVQKMGEGATEEDRKTHGEDFGDFVNSRVEADFQKVLVAMDWPTEILAEALRFASHYQRPVCAAQLMSSPYCLPAGDDAYLLSIAAWLHAPGNAGAKQAQSEFEAAASGDAP